MDKFIKTGNKLCEYQWILLQLSLWVKGKGKGKVPLWGTSTPQPQGLLCSHPTGAAHRTVYSASTSEGRNYVKGI
jgi:hypothetical protein